MSDRGKSGMSGRVLEERAQTRRASGVKLFCIQCMGGVVGQPGWGSAAREAKRCTSTECALYPHAFGRKRPPDKGPPTSPK